MDFAPSTKAAELTATMRTFLDEAVLPAEASYDSFRAERRGTPEENALPPVVEELKTQARARGLWNLFLPAVSGLTNVDYAQVAEVSGWSPNLAPEAINCAAPDTGNMETLHLFGTAEQKEQWLTPLLEGEIRSGFAMTEPDVASSDATNVQTTIRRDGDEYVISGKKWWISGAADERCKIFIVMGKTDLEAATHRQQSMVLVPRDTPG
ncbi:MAG: acyl-CoA dehydrogenase family protein, partial [Mycobacteriaceae bacterium]